MSADAVCRPDASASTPIISAMSWTSCLTSREVVRWERSWEIFAMRQGCLEMWTLGGREEGEAIEVSVAMLKSWRRGEVKALTTMSDEEAGLLLLLLPLSILNRLWCRTTSILGAQQHSCQYTLLSLSLSLSASPFQCPLAKSDQQPTIAHCPSGKAALG